MRNMITGNLLARPGREIERSAVGRRTELLRQSCMRPGKVVRLIPDEVNREVVREEESVLGARRFSI